MLLPESFLVSDNDVQLALLASDLGVNIADSTRKVFSLCRLVVHLSSIGSSLSLILVSLSLYIIESDLALIDLVAKTSQFVLSLIGIISLVLQLSNQLLMIIFSLMQSLV